MTNPVEKALAKIADRFADTVAEEGARVRAVIEAGLAQTLNANRITGARPVPIGAGGRLATGRGRLVGWSLREAAGTPAPAVVTVYAGSDTTDPANIIATVPLTAGAGATQFPSAPGVFFAEGVAVVITGTVLGALYLAAVD